MMKKIYLQIFILFIVSTIFSQSKKSNLKTQNIKSFEKIKTPKQKVNNGFTISVESTLHDTTKFVLGYYVGTFSKSYISDTAIKDLNSNKFIFKRSNKILGGIYQLKVLDKKTENKLNIIIDNGDNINFSIDSSDFNSLYTKDEKNSLFLKYQKENLKGIEEVEFCNSFIKKFPNSASVAYFELELLKFDYRANRNNIKFQDTFLSKSLKNNKRLFLMPNLYSILKLNTEIFPIDNKNYTYAINALMKDVDCKTNRNWEKFIEWTFKNIDFNESINLEPTYTELYNKYVSDTSCKITDDKLFSKLSFDNEQIKTNPLKSIIKDFKLLDSLDTSHILSNIYKNKKYTFIAIYDADCSHCQVKMPELNSSFITLKPEIKDSVQLIAIHNSINVENWKKFIKKHELNDWLNLSDEGGKYKYEIKAFSNPMFFLLNNKGEIISKSSNFKTLKSIIEK